MTLENLDRRKVEIQNRIRNLEERIQRVKLTIMKKYPGLRSQPRNKSLSLSIEVLSLTLGMSKQEIAQQQPDDDDTKENVPNLHEVSLAVIVDAQKGSRKASAR